MRAKIEFHPENGDFPHVVVVPLRGGGKMWFAYPTDECALRKLPLIESEFARLDGMIETTDAIISVRPA